MKVDCPACEFTLRGHPTTGYRCVRCHSRYSTKFVRGMRTMQIRERLNEHFGEPTAVKHAETEDSVVIFSDKDFSVTKAMQEGRDSIDDAVVVDNVEEEMNIKPTSPQELFVKEKKEYSEQH